MASTAEAEVGALFVNGKKDKEMRIALEEMGHKQPPMSIMTDNSTACGIVNNIFKQQRMHMINMSFIGCVTA
eukprot:2681796-Ditylum_brightwellii.AAC.1